VIKYDNIEKLKKDLADLLSNTQIVLFLRSKEVKITVNNNERLIIEKSQNGETTTLKRNGRLQSEWLIKTEQFDIPQNVREEINADEKSPKKLKDALRTEISFAIQLEENKLKAVDRGNRLIFTYLPTSINYDFPFLVNASFLTDAGRQHLHQDIFWNNWIFKQIPLKFFVWIAELANKSSKYNKQVLTILPHKLNAFSALEQSFNQGYKQAIDTIAFVPNQYGDLLKVSQAIFDKTHISDFISKQTLINYINQKLQKSFTIQSFVPYIEPLSALDRIGVKMFEIDDLEGFFTSNIFALEHKISENFILIRFLFDQAKHSKDTEEWNQKFKTLCFIFNQKSKLCKPIHLLFSKHSQVTDEQVIHSSVLSQIRNNQEIYDWLFQLGIQEPTDTAFINLVIQEPENFINHSNAIETIRFIFNAYKNNHITNAQFEELRKVTLFTKKGTLLSCEKCYLSDFYEPALRLEKIYFGDLYVTEDYVEGKDEKAEWKAFFLKMKVKQQIGRYELNNLSISSLSVSFGNEYFDVDNGYISKTFTKTKNGFGYGSHNKLSIFRNLSFLENTLNNLSFAKIFWNSVIYTKELELDYLNQTPNLFYGVGAGHNRFTTSIRETYFQWFVLNKECIPTTQGKCYKPEFVYLNTSEIKEIAGKYLPVFDCDFTLSPELRNFFSFIDNLKLNDYLKILENIANDTQLSEEEQKENQKRIWLIYEELALMSLHSSDKDAIKVWGTENKLLSQGGSTFFYPKDLSVATVEGFRASNLAYTKKLTPEIIDLLRLFGVAIIDKITPSMPNNKTEIEDLKNKLIYISPLAALVSVEKSKNSKDWEVEYERIKNKLKNIRFFQTSEIYLSYGNEDDKQERSSWAEGDNFYYVGNWRSLRVLDGLVEPLGKFLRIRYAERLLIVLLLETFANSIEYLKEKDYDVTLIPEHLLNQEEPESTPDPRESENTAINQGNRPYNEFDEALGRKGEKFVYEELKKIYSQKYNSSIQETQTGFKIISIQESQTGYKKINKLEVFWVNKEQNTSENYDFKIVENGKEIYIDSKATPYSKNEESKVAFYISKNELNLMETTEKYLIARVFSATTNPIMELIKLNIDNLN